MDEIVAILRDVAGNSRGRLIEQLDAEAIVEDAAMPVAVLWAERQRKIRGLRAVAPACPENRCEQVAPEVRGHVLAVNEGALQREIDEAGLEPALREMERLNAEWLRASSEAESNPKARRLRPENGSM